MDLNKTVKSFDKPDLIAMKDVLRKTNKKIVLRKNKAKMT